MPGTEGVHGRPVEIAGRVLHLGDAIPALIHRQEGVLCELLSLEPVPGYQAERPEEPRPLTLEEAVELQVPVVGDRGRLRGLRGEMKGPLVHVAS